MNKTLTSLKAVSENIRVRILLLLKDREACVCELMSVFNMAQSKLSHHLIALRDAGFLEDEKRGKWNYYRLNSKSLDGTNMELLASLSRWLADDGVIKKDERSLRKVQKRMNICCS